MTATRLDSWDKTSAFALTLPDTEPGISARMPTVRVAANGRNFIWTSHEAETSFAMWVEDGEAEMLIETDPDTFWQSPHYAGSRVILIRYASDDPDRVRYMIEQAHARAAAKKPTRKRNK
jgi:hypothetical protein